jgi:soluble lytic murein transglycosylase-like protein
MLRETHAGRRPRAGRHRMRRGGRHAAPRTSLVSTSAVWWLPVVLAAAVLAAGFNGFGSQRATPSNASTRSDDPPARRVEAVAASTASRPCPIDWRQSTWHVKKLIRCAAERYEVSPSTALYIAWRESRYRPSAYNEGGGAAGIYQHLLKYWPDRAETYGFPNRSAFNGRANIMVTMRMVRRVGWGPWAIS